MKIIENKKFLWPIKTRLWNAYKREGSGGEEMSVWRCNAHIVRGWVPCTEEDRNRVRWYSHDEDKPVDCALSCKSGAMRAVFAEGNICVCRPDKSGEDAYITEDVLRGLVESGKVRNNKLDWKKWFRGPKVWEGYKDFRRKANANY